MKSSIDLGIARSGIGLSRSAIRFVAPVLIALFVLLTAAASSVELLSIIRAYVGGEGLYSIWRSTPTRIRRTTGRNTRRPSPCRWATAGRGSRCRGTPRTSHPPAWG
jgi:hypothetical protein